jgi:tetratricopeptide (TPR) repeat protein
MKRAFSAVGVLLLLLAVHPANAEGNSVVVAKEHFKAGRELYKKGQYQDAIGEFRKAYKAKPHPVMYFNIAQCYEKLGDVGNALSNYREYLHQLPDADDRPTVEATLQTLEAKLKETQVQPLIINTTPSGATVRLDGEPAGSTPISKSVKAAVHTVEISLPGYEPAQRDIETSAEHSSQIDMTLRPLAAKLTPVYADNPLPAAATPGVSVQAAPTGPRKRLWTWLALGAGGAFAAGGALLGASAQSDANKLTTASTPWSQAQAQNLYNGSHSKAVEANACYGLAIAAVVTGGILFFVEGR